MTRTLLLFFVLAGITATIFACSKTEVHSTSAQPPIRPQQVKERSATQAAALPPLRLRTPPRKPEMKPAFPSAMRG